MNFVIEFVNHPGYYLTEEGVKETPTGCYFNCDITQDISKAARLGPNESFDFVHKFTYFKKVKIE